MRTTDLTNLANSAFDTKLGLVLTTITPERVEGYAPVEGNTQSLGLWHGGASATMIETLGSIAANAHAGEGKSAVGTELSISHLRGVRKGTIFGTATALHLGGSSAIYTVELRDDDGTLIASGRISCRLLTDHD